MGFIWTIIKIAILFGIGYGAYTIYLTIGWEWSLLVGFLLSLTLAMYLLIRGYNE